MKLNIQLFGGRGASSSNKELNHNKRLKKNAEKLVEKSNTKSNAITFNNRQNLISSIQQQINVDLGKATTERQFAPRTGLNIDSKKLTKNEFFTLRTYLNKEGIQINENGVSDYFITYKKQK